ncbi:MAG: glycosyltransferase 87 family protein [Thermoanaerobaculia bacterium]|jgi:hypothetical protein
MGAAVTNRRKVALVGAVIASEIGYASLLTLDPPRDLEWLMLIVGSLFTLLAAAYFVTRRDAASPGPRLIVLVALAFRLTLVPLGLPPDAGVSDRMTMIREDMSGGEVRFRRELLLDDDVWRYLWDAHVAAQTSNPYRAAPIDPELDRLASGAGPSGRWRVIRSNVNHPDLATIYPPVAQAVFLGAYLVAPGSVVALKLVLVAVDMAGIAALLLLLRRLDRPPSIALLYAWNPLVILMFSGAAHVDVVAVACMTWSAYLITRSRYSASGVALGLAILTKVAPLVLVPLFVRTAGKRGAAGVALTLVLVASPLLLVDEGLSASFRQFAQNWEFNSASFTLMRYLLSGLTNDPGRVTRVLLASVIVLAVAYIATRKPSSASFSGRAADTLGILLLCSPTLMPWYAPWPLALAVAGGRRAWIAMSAALVLAFPMMVDWTTRSGLLAVEAGLILLALAGQWRGTRSDCLGSTDREQSFSEADARTTSSKALRLAVEECRAGVLVNERRDRHAQADVAAP